MRLEDLRARYHGRRAREYDQDRAGQYEWHREGAVVSELLREVEVGEGSVVLDIPVGTGRFLDLYHSLGCEVIGLDVSSDMLNQARARAGELDMGGAEIREGDITAIDLEDASVDVCVVIRIANMLDLPDLERALAELARVTRHYLILGIQLQRSRIWTHWLRGSTENHDEGSTTKPHPERVVSRTLRKNRLTVFRRSTVRESESTPYHILLLSRDS